MSVKGNVDVKLEEFPKYMEEVINNWSRMYAYRTVIAIENLTKHIKDVVKVCAPVEKGNRFPKRRGKYQRYISSRMTSRDLFEPKGLVYAKGHEYSLTHLLENGHKLWQNPSKRTRAFKHWKIGEDVLLHGDAGVKYVVKELSKVGRNYG